MLVVREYLSDNTSLSPQPQSQLNSSSNDSAYTKTKNHIGVARKLWGGGGGVLSLNTCVGGMMFRQMGLLF